jgi:hypothetical protein
MWSLSQNNDNDNANDDVLYERGFVDFRIPT